MKKHFGPICNIELKPNPGIVVERCDWTESSTAKVIDFEKYSQYKQDISETVEFLNNVKDELITRMVNIASCGKWKKWSDEQLEGTIFEFSLETLSDTGDKKVDMLFALHERISGILEDLESS